MRIIKNVSFTLFGLVLTAVLLATVYLFLGNVAGTIVLVTGLIGLFVLFVFALIDLIRGNYRFLKLKNRFSISLALAYIVSTSVLLCSIWALNFILQYEFGEMSATEKIGMFQRKSAVIDEKRLEITQDYPVLKHDHITFKYHPDTEEQVHKMLTEIEDIRLLENEIFGREIPKSDPLEVIVFRDSRDYFQLNPLFSNTVGGSYESANKRVMIYRDRENSTDEESFVIGNFAHEYSHYLFDLFLMEEGINHEAVPAWYNEGIAEYVSSQAVDTLKFPGEVDTNVNFTDLHTSEEWNTESEKTDVYYLAERAIEYVTEHQGNLKILTDILVNQKETGTFEKSFDQITGLELHSLNEIIFSVNDDLQKAMETWRKKSDFKEAAKLYEEILEKHPHEGLAWHQFAIMLEEQKKWDEALNARRQVVSISPEDAVGIQNLSYLLTIFDTKESMEMANKALELTKKNPEGNVPFVQEWVDEISRYHKLVSEEKYAEAYQTILRSEQLSHHTGMMEELKNREEERLSGG